MSNVKEAWGRFYFGMAQSLILLAVIGIFQIEKFHKAILAALLIGVLLATLNYVMDFFFRKKYNDDQCMGN